MGLVAFIIAASFWPGQAGAAEASRWGSFAVVVPLALFAIPQIRLGMVHVVGALFLGYAALSLLWTTVPYDGYDELIQLGLIGLAFLIGYERHNTAPVFYGLALGLCLSSVIVLLQWRGIEPVIGIDDSAPAGLFVNPNMLGEISALTLIGVAFTEQWWLGAGILPSLAFCQSRAAFIAIGVAALIYVIRRFRLYALLAMPLLAGLTYIAAPDKWFISGTLDIRETMWRDTLDGLRVFGNGVGSFYSTFPEYATRFDTIAAQPSHAHNDLLEIAFTLGIPGVVLFVAFLVMIAVGANERDRYVLVGLSLIGLVGFPLYTPATAFVFGIVAGSGARGWDALCARQLSRGSCLYGRWQRELRLKRVATSGARLPA